jgi:integrase
MLQRIKAVFMFAMAQTPPWITGHNPATRELIITKLPRRKNTPRGKHPSLHYNEMPKCFAYLRRQGEPIESDQRSVVHHAIELTILTGVRTSELVNAQWKEFNLGKKLWTIPLERLKNEKHVDEAFEVPLSTGAINILNIRRSIELRSRGGKVLNNKAFVFPSPIKENTPIHEGSMYNYIHGKASNGRMEPWPFFDSKQLDSETKEPKRISIHGFRSTLRDWGQGKAGFTFDLMEKVINHKLSSVQASYQRSQLTEKREEVMEAWWEYCSSKLQVKKSNVSPLRRKAK